MCSYNGSVAASQAKCMFWLSTVLRDDLFLKRIKLESSFRHSKVEFELVGKYLGTVCMKYPVILVTLLPMKQLTQYHLYHRRNRHLALIRATVIQHPPYERGTRFASATKPFGPVAIHSAARNCRTSKVPFVHSPLSVASMTRCLSTLFCFFLEHIFLRCFPA